MNVNLKREALRRCRVLQHLQSSDPYPINDNRLLTDLQTSETDLDFVSQREVRQILKYLQGHGLCELGEARYDEYTQWSAVITSLGVDYLAGIGEELAGVQRPIEY